MTGKLGGIRAWVGPEAATVPMRNPPGGKGLDQGKSARKAAGWLAPLAARLFKKKKPEPGQVPVRRLLFLDDDPRRAEIFLADNPQAVWVQTVVECVSCLQETWDEVHLDHDLGGKQHVSVDEVDCGMEVIRWLCKEPRDHLLPTLFFVHSHNYAAGLLMVMHMRSGGFRAEFRPFGHDLERLLGHNEPKEDAVPEVKPTAPPRRWLAWLRSWRKGSGPYADTATEPESNGRV